MAEQTESPPPTTAEVLQKIFSEAVDLARVKDAGYGQAWRAQGYIGNIGRVLSKSERLRNLAWKDSEEGMADPHPAEMAAIEEELRDIVNIAAFALVNLRSGNRWGNR